MCVHCCVCWIVSLYSSLPAHVIYSFLSFHYSHYSLACNVHCVMHCDALHSSNPPDSFRFHFLNILQTNPRHTFTNAIVYEHDDTKSYSQFMSTVTEAESGADMLLLLAWHVKTAIKSWRASVGSSNSFLVT